MTKSKIFHIEESDLIEYKDERIAIFLSFFRMLLRRNLTEQKHVIDGRVWIEWSQKGLSNYYGYLSEDQVYRIVKKMRKLGIVATEKHNANASDQTLYYTVLEDEFSIPRNREMDSAESRRPTAKSRNVTNREIAESTYIHDTLNIHSNIEKEIKEKEQLSLIPTDQKANNLSGKVQQAIRLDDAGDLSEVKVDPDRFDAAMANTFPHVQKLSNPLTLKQAQKLITQFSEPAVYEILLQMENFKPLRKKYTSAYLTARNWLQRKTKNSGAVADKNADILTDEVYRQESEPERIIDFSNE